MCTTLTQQGTPVDLTTTTATAAAPTGGTIADGTYTVTAAKAHTAQVPEGTKVGSVGSITIKLTGNKYEVIATSTNGETRRAGTYVTNGVDISLTETCTYPASDAGPGGAATKYSATATTFTQYTTQNATTVEIVYTKK